MAADQLLAALVRANLAAGAGILLALALRAPVRRLAGSRAAYALWLIPVLAAAANALPARIVTVLAQRPVEAPVIAPALIGQTAAVPALASPVAAAPIDWTNIALAVWALGAALAVAHLFISHQRALRRLGRLTPAHGFLRTESSDIGPLAIGLIAPRILLPADFETRFDPAERKAVIAHEQAHLAAGHLAVRIAAQVAARLNWFNPLIHLAVGHLAVDQELACDETVVGRHPAERKAYARALLKTQAMVTPPLGCAWPSRSARLLKDRVQLVSRGARRPALRHAGFALATAAAAASGLAAWAAQPPQVRLAQGPAVSPARTTAPATAAVLAAPAQAKMAAPSATPTVQAGAGGLAALPAPASAPEAQPAPPPRSRYNFAAEFDPASPIHLKGTILGVQWAKLHSWVQVRAQDGQMWLLQAADADVLRARGLNEQSFQEGAEVTIDGYQANDKRCVPSPLTHADTCKGAGRLVAVSGKPPAFIGANDENVPHDGFDPDDQ